MSAAPEKSAKVSYGPSVKTGAHVDREDPIVQDTLQAFRNLTQIKVRLGVLESLNAELIQRTEKGAKIQNDLVYQMVVDSFDMLVVDLASLGEGLCSGNIKASGSTGLFNKLKSRLDCFRPYTADDFGPSERDDESSRLFDQRFKEDQAEKINVVFLDLFQHMPPISEGDVIGLLKRFKKETEATSQDRSKVRAHRYEGHPEANLKSFQTIDKVRAQIEVFDKCLNDLLLALTCGNYLAKPATRAHPAPTSADLADIINFGTIDVAAMKYGLTPEDKLYQRPSSQAEEPFFYRDYRFRHLSTEEHPFSMDSRRHPSALPSQVPVTS